MTSRRITKKSKADIQTTRSSNDNIVMRALVANRKLSLSRWTFIFVGIFLLGSVVFAFRTNAASTGFNHKPYGAVDATTDTTGVIKMTGWAVDSQTVREGGIASVQIYVDKVDNGHYFGKATRGIARPTICGNFILGRVGCPQIGWKYNLDTVKHHINDGKHTLIAKIIDKDKQPHYYLAKKTFYVNNAGGGPVAPPPVTVDEPPGITIEKIAQSDNSFTKSLVTVSGFSIDGAHNPEVGVSKVQIYVDTVLVGDATIGQPSPFWCSVVFTTWPGCPNIGFTYTFDGSALGLGLGNHQIKAIAYDAGGQPGEDIRDFSYTPITKTGTRSTTDRVPDEVTGGNLIHYIYMLPYDGPDRELDLFPIIKTSMAAQQQWFMGQTGGRTIRYDTYSGGEPDITFLRVADPTHTMAFYKSLSFNLWSTIFAEVGAAGFNDPAKRYSVIFEGGSVWACGTGGSPMALTSLDSTQTDGFQCSMLSFTSDPATPILLDYISLHELTHVLGQTPTCAPHNDALNPRHVTDTNDDLMHGVLYGTPATVLDFNKDDYYFVGGATGCIPETLNVSPFIN